MFVNDLHGIFGYKPRVAIILGAEESSFDIPVDSIVSASGLTSWEGRGSRTSKDKIVDYSSRNTEIPAVEQLFAFILPNGKTVFQTGNAHRVAAAKLKGQKTISFHGNLYIREANFTPSGLES